MLSNLGAIEENKAVTREVLNNSERLRGKEIEGEISRLLETGYVKENSGRLYLTKAGLFRALSRFS
jgi:predicted HTH transcriptional regulator